MDGYSQVPQVPWTEAQWIRVQETVRDEAKKQRVAASFLPVTGPLPPDAQFVAIQTLRTKGDRLAIDDHATRRLTTISVNVELRSAQVAESDLSSALVAFRRAATLIARAEDTLVFQGQPMVDPPFPALLPCRITGGEKFEGLLNTALNANATTSVTNKAGVAPGGSDLVAAVSGAISQLENFGHLGPYALVLDTRLFDIAQEPNKSLVLPADRIKPLLDGPLQRSSTLRVPQSQPGVLVSLGDELIDLVVASEIAVRFLQITAAASPKFLFRVSERLTLRIKQPTAIRALI